MEFYGVCILIVILLRENIFFIDFILLFAFII